MDNYTPKFCEFAKKVAETNYTTNTTTTGALTIQQSTRNEMRKEGLEALMADLMHLYGDSLDVVETKEGICIAIENKPGDYTVTWELKSAIKSLDFDPFIQASNYEEMVAEKAEKKARIEAEKASRAQRLEEKRARKLAEIEAKKNLLAD